GVADSVEAHTGGVRLDTLFVDEGFGTLDPDSLELAMDELDGLRAGGRMVGVISHVATLRERIRMGIEVTPTPAGSKVQVGAVPASWPWRRGSSPSPAIAWRGDPGTDHPRTRARTGGRRRRTAVPVRPAARSP